MIHKTCSASWRLSVTGGILLDTVSTTLGHRERRLVKRLAVGLDALAPIFPGHWPLHQASSLKRPGREKPTSPHPQGSFRSSLQHSQFSLWVLLIHKARYFARSGSFSSCWKGWLGRVGPPRQAESCWLLWVHVSPSPAQQEGAPK